MFLLKIRNTQDPRIYEQISCGRSPTGLCVGWHALKKEDYEKKKKKYEELSEDEKKGAFHVRAIDGIGE